MLRKASRRSSRSGRRTGIIAEAVALTFSRARPYVSICFDARTLMDHDNYSDTYIRGILNTVKTIAMVGVSANTSRPSYFAFKYLMERGYRMIPVNPGLAGQELLGQKVYARLADIPEPVDMVDIFRASRYALAIVQRMLALDGAAQGICNHLRIRHCI